MKIEREIRDELLRRIAEGRSMRSVCRDEDMPSRTVVLGQLNEDAEFASQYARAAELRADAQFDEIFEIADDTEGDPQRDRLRVDTRKWALARMAPRKYGDRLDVNHGGAVQVHLPHDPRKL